MLRPLTEQDVPYLLEIESAAQALPWTETAFKTCLQAGYDGWVLKDGDLFIGFVIFSLELHEGHILNSGVHPDFQRLGFGHQLLSYAVDQLKQNGACVIYLEVRRSNGPAIALYTKMDFNQISVRKDYYREKNRREDALIFAKNLSTE